MPRLLSWRLPYANVFSQGNNDTVSWYDRPEVWRSEIGLRSGDRKLFYTEIAAMQLDVIIPPTIGTNYSN